MAVMAVEALSVYADCVRLLPHRIRITWEPCQSLYKFTFSIPAIKNELLILQRKELLQSLSFSLTMPWPVNHAKNVRVLYKSLFRLHRGLPEELRAIGDAYAREEFKRHREASEAHARAFMQEWTVKKTSHHLSISTYLSAYNLILLFEAMQQTYNILYYVA